VRRFPAIPSTPRDPTGAGDIFLASLMAAAFASAASTGSRVDVDALRFAATVAAISVEGLGLNAVPGTSAIRRRLASHLVFGRD
jgi:sugar/nucleoside kinase (ribokinase family)